MEFRAWIVSNVSAESKNIVKNFWVENLEGENRSHTDNILNLYLLWICFCKQQDIISVFKFREVEKGS